MDNTLSAIKKMEIIAREIPGVISLAQGIPCVPSDRIIRKEVIMAINNNKVDKYSLTAGAMELRNLISEKLKKEGMEYDAAREIVVVAGAIEGLTATLLSILSPGDEVIVFTPTYYSNYREIVKLAHANVVDVPLVEKSGWSLDLNLFKKRISRLTRAIIICNPNNPTGSLLRKEELLEIGELAKKRNIVLILDDVYYNILYEKNIFLLARNKQFKNNIVRIVSFSKDFALSGWRIGFLPGPEKLISKILPIHDCLVNCAPVVSQYAMMSAIRHESKIVFNTMKKYRKNKELMASLLKQLSGFLSFTVPKGTYYFFPKIFKIKNSEDFCLKLLRKKKLAVVPGSDFGPGGEGHIRLCFGKSEKEIVDGIRRLKQFLFINKF
jgi:aminotransferase